MTADAAFGALFTLIGAVTGAILALVPLTLLSRRDRHARLRGFVVLLDRERAVMASFCEDVHDNISKGPENAVYTFRELTVPAWHAAGTDADFIEALSGEEWAAITNAYGAFTADCRNTQTSG